MGSAHPDDLAHRRAVEAMICEEEQSLLEVVRLLQAGIPFVDWPAGPLVLLRAALTEGGSAVEAWKARALGHHLFRSPSHSLATLAQSDLPPPRRRIAERVRADLAGLVPLGAGLRCRGRE